VGNAATLIGGVLTILGVALGLTNYLVIAQIPMLAVEWVQSFVQSPLFFLLLLNIFLLIVGCLMDIFSAIVVVVPLIVPLGMHFGVDPFHLGIVFLANMELGYLTPPVGMNLFFASYRFNRPLPEVYRASLPFLAIRVVTVLLVTYVPWLTGFLPRLLGM
jgi:tripartite ATP-independent transporter DctM subunit